MNPLQMDKVCDYIHENIMGFHQRRIEAVEGISLDALLEINPYIFRIKNITLASEVTDDLLDTFIFSLKEEFFGNFLKELAIFVAEMTFSGYKSTVPGVDLEFVNNGIHYIVLVKSGTNWENSLQQDKLEQNLKNAVGCVKQSTRGTNVQAVWGICYGKTKTSHLRGYLKIAGQNFWYLISENKELYIEIVKLISYHINEYNGIFRQQEGRISNLLVRQFIERFCDDKGMIDWNRLVQFNSSNFDLDEFLP